MNSKINLAAVAALGLFALAPAANAQVFISTDTTINHAINDDVFVGEDSNLNPFNPTVGIVTGGDISGALILVNNSVVNMSGGSVGSSVQTNVTSTFNLTGGTILGGIGLSDNSIANISGGSIPDGMTVYQSSTLNFFGTGLNATLIDPNDVNGFSDYTLSGTLADGTSLSALPFFIQNGNGASFTLNTVGSSAVPEPGSVALLVGMTTVGAGVLRRRRK